MPVAGESPRHILCSILIILNRYTYLTAAEAEADILGTGAGGSGDPGTQVR